jgi:hypothetical protein
MEWKIIKYAHHAPISSYFFFLRYWRKSEGKEIINNIFISRGICGPGRDIDDPYRRFFFWRKKKESLRGSRRRIYSVQFN